MKKSKYQITIYYFNSKKEVQFMSILKTKPITKSRCFEIIKEEAGPRNHCFSVKPIQ